jgi:hypothetical protein
VEGIYFKNYPYPEMFLTGCNLSVPNNKQGNIAAQGMQ